MSRICLFNVWVQALLGVLIIAVVLVTGCAASLTEAHTAQQTPPPPLAPLPQPTEPDEATFGKYFSDMGLGKLPPGEKLPHGLQLEAAVFAPSDGLCIYGTAIKEVQLSLATYDTTAKEFVSDKLALPQALQKGGFASCSSVNLPTGKYEYEVYAGEILIAALPFEVR